MVGKFKALVESKCRSVNSEFLVADGAKHLFLDKKTATDLGIVQIAKAVSAERNEFQNSVAWKDEEC